MSNLVEKFNTAPEEKKIESAKSLVTGQRYPLRGLKCIKTKNGPCLLAELQDCKVFLPDRYSEVFSAEEIREFNLKLQSGQDDYLLYCRGLTDFEIVYGSPEPVSD